MIIARKYPCSCCRSTSTMVLVLSGLYFGLGHANTSIRNQNRGTMFCSEILNLHLQSKAGRVRTLKVNLEEIWSSGALFLTDVRIRPFTPFRFVGGGLRIPWPGDRPKITARPRLFRRDAIRSEVHLVGTKISPPTPFQSPGPAGKQDFRNHVMRAQEPTVLPWVKQRFQARAAGFVPSIPGPACGS